MMSKKNQKLILKKSNDSSKSFTITNVNDFSIEMGDTGKNAIEQLEKVYDSKTKKYCDRW